MKPAVVCTFVAMLLLPCCVADGYGNSTITSTSPELDYGDGTAPIVSAAAALPAGFSRGPFGLAESPWPKSNGNAANSGFGLGSGARGRIKWAIKFNNTDSSPSIGEDGTVYVVSGDGYLYALNPATGAGKWKVLIRGDTGSGPAISRQGVVYVEGGDDANPSVFAVDAATGGVLWKVQTKTSGQDPAIAPNGEVLIATADGYVQAMDGATGAVKWKAKTGTFITGIPAIGEDGTVYVGSHDCCLYALDGTTGTAKWKFRCGNATIASAALAPDGTVYVGALDDNVYAVNARSGVLKWKTNVAAEPKVLGLTPDVASTPAIGSDGTVYVNVEETLCALNGRTGSIEWKCNVGGKENDSDPSIGSDGTIYDASNGGNLYAIDYSTGSVKWKVQIGSVDAASPAVGADGTIYVGGGDDGFFAID